MRPFYRLAGVSARTIALPLMLALAALAAASLPRTADAVVTWLMPAGGEVWTAGTTHTIVWSGGGPSVNAVAFFQQSPPYGSAALPGLTFFPNDGHGSWTLPTNPSYLPPGTYKLAIGFPSDPNGPFYSNEFTIQAPPECLSSCQQVSASFPVADPSYSALEVIDTATCSETPHGQACARPSGEGHGPAGRRAGNHGGSEGSGSSARRTGAFTGRPAGASR